MLVDRRPSRSETDPADRKGLNAEGQAVNPRDVAAPTPHNAA
jgi:hypothetical protein